MSLHCSDEVFQRAYSTRIPCLLTDGKEVASRQELTPQELLEYQKEASVATGNNWCWVEACIKSAGQNDWLVFDKEQNHIGCVNALSTDAGHIYSVVIENVRHEFRYRSYAVAASFAYK